MTERQSKNSGYTFLELLIVLSIFALLMGMVFSSLNEGQKVSTIARDEGEMNQNLQDILNVMTSEMRSIGFPPASYYDLSFLQNPNSPKNVVSQGLMEAGTNSIKFQGDVNGDREVDYFHYYLNGSSVPYSLNRVSGNIHADGSLPGGSPQKLSEQVENLRFRYLDRAGNQTASIADVVTIEIQLTLRTKKPDPITRIYRSISESTRIRPQNL
jgi:prepilin-type N-terminal cleavage/methylation domain-containing protein